MHDDEWDSLNSQIMTCTRCRLSESRTNAVPGEGPVPCPIMMIGEAPGEKEDQQGRPFVGRAGTVLNRFLEETGLPRDEVFITSIVKCRPPKNRDPKEDEIHSCSGHLDRQIAHIKPRVIVPMGRFAAGVIFSRFGIGGGKISEVHGKLFRGAFDGDEVMIFPVYHPAVVTHNPPLRSELAGDFARLKEMLSRINR
ncbi:DNA polymerase [Methanolinea mesophila]|uniref:uracil-DNA glycosylase n=1 Tax=Methanolinea mesophila TaxID=547055 RepID=UPI001AE95554|nr:uracil-DNA glycosylase [Methanolinea mesophila]MBP1929221.1 DNA polymerase [Methanolinea mesophila]